MPETAAEPATPTPTKLLVARLCVILLLSMIFAVLFRDFAIWAIFGIRFLLSPRFRNLLPYFQGLSVILMYLFLLQSYQSWKQGKPHYILIEFFVLVIGGIPLARPVARWTAKAVIPATAGMSVSLKSLLIPMLVLALCFGCKLLTLSRLWRIVAPAFKPQEQRRIVISD